MIRFDATILEPEGVLPPEVQASFEAAIQARGASDLRVNANEGQVAVSFLLEAESEREALLRGSDITLAALAPFADVRWVSSGVTYWTQTSPAGRSVVFPQRAARGSPARAGKGNEPPT